MNNSFSLDKKDLIERHNHFIGGAYHFYAYYFSASLQDRPFVLKNYVEKIQRWEGGEFLLNEIKFNPSNSSIIYNYGYHIKILIDDLVALSNVEKTKFMEFDNGIDYGQDYTAYYGEDSVKFNNLITNTSALLESEKFNPSSDKIYYKPYWFFDASYLEIIVRYVQNNPHGRIRFVEEVKGKIPNQIVRLFISDLDQITGAETPKFLFFYGENKLAFDNAKKMWLARLQ